MLPDTMMATKAAITERRKKIISAAERWIGTVYLLGGGSSEGIDCSHFVYEVYKESLDATIQYLSSGFLAGSMDYLQYGMTFADVEVPEVGDLILWDGHVAIVTDPTAGEFIGAQSSTGVAKANWKTNSYWKQRSGRKFRRHILLF
jgi:lipoprotein Spr